MVAEKKEESEVIKSIHEGIQSNKLNSDFYRQIKYNLVSSIGDLQDGLKPKEEKDVGPRASVMVQNKEADTDDELHPEQSDISSYNSDDSNDFYKKEDNNDNHIHQTETKVMTEDYNTMK